MVPSDCFPTTESGTRKCLYSYGVAKNTPVTVHRTERVLATMVASSIGLAIVGIVALLIAGVARVDTTEGLWVFVVVLPPLALVFGVAFIIALVTVSAIRRGRAARDAV